ncbi:MAG: hypothetical protein RIS76_1532 [Verrucomicrobiota bacterium]|jgi:hypothetical protein
MAHIATTPEPSFGLHFESCRWCILREGPFRESDVGKGTAVVARNWAIVPAVLQIRTSEATQPKEDTPGAKGQRGAGRDAGSPVEWMSQTGTGGNGHSSSEFFIL